jgi:isocitrate dehydrogenase
MHRGTPFEVAIQTSIFTRAGCERIMRFAFELARKRNKKKRVTSITKSNAQKYSMVFWDEIFREVAADYPDIETNANLVDAAAMNFIRRPEMFDVVVASNLFADKRAGRAREQLHGTNTGVLLKTLADGQNQAVQCDVVRNVRGVANGTEIDGIEFCESL